jgi:type III secretion system OrgA/MxiK family protein
MLAASSRLQTVMFDPLSYIHPERFALPARLDAARQHAIINRMLLDHYRLSSCVPRAAPGSLDHLLAQHWELLPQLAYLLACQRFRVALLRGGRLLKVPAWARSFAILPLQRPDDADAAADTLGSTALLEHGLVELLSRCRHAAPALQQRIPLLFPSFGKTTALPPPCATTQGGNSLLILALQHVKSFSGSTTIPTIRKRIDQARAVTENAPQPSVDDRCQEPRAQAH